MTNFYRVLSLAALSFFALAQPANAQDTYTEVRNILVSNCASACHGNTSYSFNIDDDADALYDSLINATPKNPHAAGQGYKLITPGYPDRSYLLRKVANCISGDLAMVPAEGNLMPDGGAAPLAEQEIELIRQWILFGAPKTGNVVDKAVIDEYYTIGGIPKIQRPTPPKSCEGFQIHMGPIFFEGGEESEYFLRYDLNLPDTIEVTGLELFFNDESHHFILRKYTDGSAQNWPQGLIPLNPLTAFDSDKEYVMAWQDNQSFTLPNGTAYIWDENESLDLNLHMYNPHNQILPGEVYLNIYTQPKGNADKEMKSSLINNAAIFLPPNSVRTLTTNNGIQDKSIWTITSHTHKFGTNYDIFFRNSDGSKGRKVFDGSFDYEGGFDTGTYDWEHPPTVFYNPLLDMTDTVNNGTKPTGLIDEATYNNTSNSIVTFGFTTEEEMMIYYVQYVDGHYDIPANPPYIPACTEVFKDPCATVGILELASSGVGINVYPNPSNGVANIEYTLDENAQNVTLQVVNLLGEVVSDIVAGEGQLSGKHVYQYDGTSNASGVYFVRLSIDGAVSTQKILHSGK